MAINSPTSTVIVGIDGSEAALNAAQWAIDEALARDATLRLVYATKPTHVSADDYYEDIHRARAALEAAGSAVEATGKPVSVQTSVVDGPPAAALIEQSAGAAMLCVGTVGIDRYARSILGSTATEVAEKANCPVAVIRPREEDGEQTVEWIVVALDGRSERSAVIERAMREAELRHAPVLMLGDDGMHDWRQRFPDVHVYPLADEADVAEFLKKHDERVQLAVIGSSEADELAQIVGPHGHPVFHHAHSSALVVPS